MASRRIPSLLALEVESADRPSADRQRDSGVDPPHLSREPAVGRASNSIGYPAYTIDTFSLSITLSFNNHPVYAAGRSYAVNHKHRSASDQLAPTPVQPEVTRYGKEEAAPSVDSASGDYLSWRSQRTDCQSLRTSFANHKPETKKQHRKGGK